MRDAIAIRDLCVRRGGRAVLRNLSLTVPGGEIVGLLGPSGGGKSTLMRAIVGVQIMVSGHVEVLGEPAGSPGLRSRVAYVTQAPSVYADLSVEENLRYFARVLGAEPAAAHDAIERVGLSGAEHDVAGALSGGQLARVSLATALLGQPELLVLDEPTVGLDPVLRADLWRQFRELAVAGATLLVSSHVMDEATRCDSLLLMRDGEIIASGTPHELLERTGAEDMEAAFLALVAEREGAA